MVDANPGLGRAHLGRFLYRSEFAPPADSKDLDEALELSPDDPEALFTAARVAEQKPDFAAAIAYLEKAHALDPRNLAVTMALAVLQTRDPGPAGAEATIRKAFEERPTVGLAFLLAETLIVQGKIDGDQGAKTYIEILRKEGLGDTSACSCRPGSRCSGGTGPPRSTRS